jgi:hypothetical protein
MRFSLIKLSQALKANFLEAMDWSRHRRHLLGVKIGGGGVRAQIKSGVDNLDTPNRPLICLRVDDYNTRGLVGDEFDNLENFYLLCRAEYMTPDRAWARGCSGGFPKYQPSSSPPR